MALHHSAKTATGQQNAGKLLHGSDIPKQFDGVVVKVKAIREAPANFRSPYIVDFAEPLPYGCKAWGVNWTNAEIISQKIGDDLEAIIGKRMFLKKVRVNNPATDEEVWSLMVAKIEGERAAESKVSAAGKTKKDVKASKIAEGVSEKDLPF